MSYRFLCALQREIDETIKAEIIYQMANVNVVIFLSNLRRFKRQNNGTKNGRHQLVVDQIDNC